MKTKPYKFDVEMIIDHNIQVIGKECVNVSSHRTFRGLSLVNITDLIRSNSVPEDEDVKITFNIRGVNY